MTESTFPAKAVLIASLLAFVAYAFLHVSEEHGVALILLKGAAVGLLALFALLKSKGPDGALLTAVLAMGSMGDMAIESDLSTGAAFFLIGHLTAITLYIRNRRKGPSISQKGLALALLVAVPAIAWSLPDDRESAPLLLLYALALGAMAASAWLSRFSRYSVGLGAVLFVASDLLIFARMGPLEQSPVPGMLIWPLYYLGQYLICLGVVRGIQAPGNSTPPPASR